MLSGQSTDQTMRVLEGAAAPCRRLLVYQGLSNDGPWDNYRRSELFVLFGLYRRATRVLRRALVHDTIRSLGDAISQRRQIHDRYRVISMNPKCLVIYFTSTSAAYSTAWQYFRNWYPTGAHILSRWETQSSV